MKNEHLLIHKDFGSHVIEFCAKHRNCSIRKIYGKEAKAWQEKLVKGND